MGECSVSRFNYRCDSKLANRRILGKEKEPGVGKLGWHGNFDTGFERNTVYFVAERNKY